MDQSDVENNSGSETDEAAEINVEVASPKKQKNELNAYSHLLT